MAGARRGVRSGGDADVPAGHHVMRRPQPGLAELVVPAVAAAEVRFLGTAVRSITLPAFVPRVGPFDPFSGPEDRTSWPAVGVAGGCCVRVMRVLSVLCGHPATVYVVRRGRR
ncbi:hypothetical protein GCM10010399_00200 [Dactylosporangium fulvum]